MMLIPTQSAQPLPKPSTDPSIGDFTVTRVTARALSPFSGRSVYRLMIGGDGLSQPLVIQSKRRRPQLAARLKRKRLHDGFPVVWSNPGSTSVNSGGFLAGVVPDNWRLPAPPKIQQIAVFDRERS